MLLLLLLILFRNWIWGCHWWSWLLATHTDPLSLSTFQIRPNITTEPFTIKVGISGHLLILSRRCWISIVICIRSTAQASPTGYIIPVRLLRCFTEWFLTVMLNGRVLIGLLAVRSFYFFCDFIPVQCFIDQCFLWNVFSFFDFL